MYLITGPGKLFLFVNHEGKICRCKKDADAKKKVENGDLFTLVLCEFQEISSICQTVFDGTDLSKVIMMHQILPAETNRPESMKFNSLLWLNENSCEEEILLPNWYQLLEIYQGANLNLCRYVSFIASKTQ